MKRKEGRISSLGERECTDLGRWYSNLPLYGNGSLAILCRTAGQRITPHFRYLSLYPKDYNTEVKRDRLVEEGRNGNLTKRQPTAVTQEPDWKISGILPFSARFIFVKQRVTSMSTISDTDTRNKALSNS